LKKKAKENDFVIGGGSEKQKSTYPSFTRGGNPGLEGSTKAKDRHKERRGFLRVLPRGKKERLGKQGRWLNHSEN